MNATKIVKEIMQEPLEQKGFFYQKGLFRYWEFVKNDCNLRQKIIVDNSYKRETSIYFTNNMGGEQIVNVRALIMPSEARNNMSEAGKFSYSSETEYREILKEFLEIVENKGIKYLERMSTPCMKISWGREEHSLLYENHATFLKKYEEKYSLYNSNWEKEVENVEKCIRDWQENKKEEIVEELVGIAAVYGNIVIRELRGTWKLVELNKKCIVREFEGVNCGFIIPIDIIFSAYNEGSYKRLKIEIEIWKEYRISKEMERMRKK